jgi:hypothetical protein
MPLSSVIRRLILTLAVFGLILAPIARPVMAMPMPADAMMSGDMASANAIDMPCCPDGMAADKAMPDTGTASPGMGDCAKVCPLMAVCMVASLSGLPEGPVLSFPLAITRIVHLKNDRHFGSLTRAPSPRPPNA